MNRENNACVLTLRYMLTTAFLSGLPTSRIIWDRIEEQLNILVDSFGHKYVENLIIESTVGHKISIEYPRNSIYSRKVQKWLNEIRCKYDWPTDWDSNTDVVSIPDSDLGYKTYFLEYDHRYITLLESFEGITRGTTGLSSWGASSVLSSWCSENTSVINNRNIIELGAGVGYTAASILTSHNPSSYTATDYHPTVLSILQHNLSLLRKLKCQDREELMAFCLKMKPKMEEEELAPGEFQFWEEGNELLNAGSEVTVKQLDWRRPLPAGLHACDVILAADVVYALHLLPDLVRVIRTLLSRNHDTQEKDAINRKFGEDQTKGTRNIQKETHESRGMKPNGRELGRGIMSEKIKRENFNNKYNCEQSAASSSELNEINKADKLERDSCIEREINNEGSRTACPAFTLPAAFVACTRRDPRTVSEFLKEVSSQGLQVRPIFQITLDREESLFSYNESYKPIIIYQITL